MVAALAVVVVAGVAAIAVSFVAQRKSDSIQTETRPVSVSGTPLPEMPADSSAADPAVGMVIPSVTGESFDGTPVAIAPEGKAKVIIFLAHWCPHCQAEVPRLVAWMQEKSLPANVEVVSVSTAVKPGASNYPPSRWIDREGWKVPILADDENNSVGKAFGVQGYPTFVVASADGKVIGRSAGEISMQQWEGMLLSAAASAGSAQG
jgi:cytochrome c biogenesis protein CcmG/thiol:disulfide interchange protein DsbE